MDKDPVAPIQPPKSPNGLSGGEPRLFQHSTDPAGPEYEGAARSAKQNEQTTSNTPEIPVEQSKGSAGPSGANGSQVSDRKKQANRENAKRSTGPKTLLGKDAVRYNAVKYGLYAGDVVIRHGDAQESQEEFDILLDGLRRAWAPTDVMQHCLVRTIAEAEWRLRRAHRAEVGEIRRHTDSYYARLFLRSADDLGLVDGSVWSRPECKQSARNTRLSVQDKLQLLGVVRQEVEERGYILDHLQLALDRTFGKEDLFTTRIHQFSRLVQYQESEAKKTSGAGVEQTLEGCSKCGEALGADDYKKILLGMIDARVAVLNNFLENLQQGEEREHQATLLAHNLPSKEFLDRLVRYETALERKKEKAIATLLKLKAKG